MMVTSKASEAVGGYANAPGCVLALRWNLDKPFSMTEPPTEYKGFLSKPRGGLDGMINLHQFAVRLQMSHPGSTRK